MHTLALFLSLIISAGCWAAEEVKPPKGAKAVAPSAALLDGVWKLVPEAKPSGPDLVITCDGDAITCSLAGKTVGTGKIGTPIAFADVTHSVVFEYYDGTPYTLKDGTVVLIGKYRHVQVASTDPTTGESTPRTASEPRKWTAHTRQARN